MTNQTTTAKAGDQATYTNMAVGDQVIFISRDSELYSGILECIVFPTGAIRTATGRLCIVEMGKIYPNTPEIRVAVKNYIEIVAYTELDLTMAKEEIEDALAVHKAKQRLL